MTAELQATWLRGSAVMACTLVPLKHICLCQEGLIVYPEKTASFAVSFQMATPGHHLKGINLCSSFW